MAAMKRGGGKSENSIRERDVFCVCLKTLRLEIELVLDQTQH
jgi:hypothetical protein